MIVISGISSFPENDTNRDWKLNLALKICKIWVLNLGKCGNPGKHGYLGYQLYEKLGKNQEFPNFHPDVWDIHPEKPGWQSRFFFGKSNPDYIKNLE